VSLTGQRPISSPIESDSYDKDSEFPRSTSAGASRGHWHTRTKRRIQTKAEEDISRDSPSFRHDRSSMLAGGSESKVSGSSTLAAKLRKRYTASRSWPLESYSRIKDLEFSLSTSAGPYRSQNKNKRHIDPAETQHALSNILVGGSESKLFISSNSSPKQRKRRPSRSSSPRAFPTASESQKSTSSISSGAAFYSRIVAQQIEKQTSSKGKNQRVPSSPLLRPVIERRGDRDTFKLHDVGTPASY